MEGWNAEYYVPLFFFENAGDKVFYGTNTFGSWYVKLRVKTLQSSNDLDMVKPYLCKKIQVFVTWCQVTTSGPYGSLI